MPSNRYVPPNLYGAIYLLIVVAPKDDEYQFVKLGKTTKQDKGESRLKGNQTGNHLKLAIYYAAETHVRRVARAETEMHEWLRERCEKTDGGDEWFKVRTEDLTAIVLAMEIASEKSPPPKPKKEEKVKTIFPTAEQYEAIYRMRQAGIGARKIADTFGVTHWQIRQLKERVIFNKDGTTTRIPRTPSRLDAQ